jgi:hypothetical protein
VEETEEEDSESECYHLNRKSCRVSYLSMIRIPAFKGPWFAVENTQINTGVFGPPGPFQNTLHGVNVSPNLSTVCPVYFTDLLSSPSHCIVVFRIGNPCLRDKHNIRCLCQWDPKFNLGVFYRQFQHRCNFCAINK